MLKIYYIYRTILFILLFFSYVSATLENNHIVPLIYFLLGSASEGALEKTVGISSTTIDDLRRKVDATRAEYHKIVSPESIRKIIKAYKKTKDKRVLANKNLEEHTDQYYSCFMQKKNILDNIASIINRLDYINPKITELKLLLNKDLITMEMIKKIDKSILNLNFNPNLPINNPDFFALIRYIEEYITNKNKLNNCETNLKADYDVLDDVEHCIENLHNDYSITRSIYSISYDLKVYNNLFNAENALKDYVKNTNILNLRVCSKEIKKCIKLSNFCKEIDEYMLNLKQKVATRKTDNQKIILGLDHILDRIESKLSQWLSFLYS